MEDRRGGLDDLYNTHKKKAHTPKSNLDNWIREKFTAKVKTKTLNLPLGIKEPKNQFLFDYFSHWAHVKHTPIIKFFDILWAHNSLIS